MIDAMATLHRTIVGRIPRFALFSALAGAAVLDPAKAQSTTLISVDSAGTQGAGLSGLHIALSANGRYVAFESWADNLVGGDTNYWTDVFVRDRLTGTTECVSVDSSGNFGDAINEFPAISGDGSVVAFVSAWPFVAGDTNNVEDVYLRDRSAGTIERVNVRDRPARTVGKRADLHALRLRHAGRRARVESVRRRVPVGFGDGGAADLRADPFRAWICSPASSRRTCAKRRNARGGNDLHGGGTRDRTGE